MVHRYEARTMMHMCGTVWPFLDRLIELAFGTADDVRREVRRCLELFQAVLGVRGSTRCAEHDQRNPGPPHQPDHNE
jgi:hypothetical protein